MAPPRQKLISDLFHAAVARPQEERSAFLKEACAGDTVLQEEVESLLRYEFVATEFFDSPAGARIQDGHPTSPEMVGRQLGPYQIVALLGAGGMGEVYRARDTRLDRSVALKVIASDLIDDAQARERFEKEARAIASLSHPNICVLHDVGSANGIEFLVMEYLEGETLAERLARQGALPLDETLRIATELGDALTVAHRAGIVHRDLKPSNIMLARSGGPRDPLKVKVLDFGLAKLRSQPLTGSSQRTITDIPMTNAHAVVGTLPYMAPEQLQGRPTDARADLFAFGAILYEMASGRRAFSGDSQASLIAAILDRDPEPLVTVQSQTPSALDRLIRKCLAKDPDARWQSADDLADELRWIATGLNEGQPAPSVPARPPRRAARLVGIAGALTLVLVAGAAIWKWNELVAPRGPTGTLRATQITANPLERRVISAVLSPDGKYAAYSDPRGVHVRVMDAVDSQLLPETEGMIVRRWSGDGTRVVANRFLKDAVEQWSISLLGSRERVQVGVLSPDGTVLVNIDNGRVILTEVRTATNRTLVDYGTGIPAVDFGDAETSVTAVEWSPSGRWLLVALVSRAGGQNRALIERVDPHTGSRASVFEDQQLGPITAFAVSRSGLVVYCHAARNIWSFQFNESTGTRLGEPRKITDWRDVTVQSVSASADGKRLLYLRTEQQSDVHVGRLVDDGTKLESPERMTMDDRSDIPYAWAPDSRSLYFWSNRSGNTDIYGQAIGEEKADLIVGGAGHQCCPRVTPDGKWILFRNHSPDQPRGGFPTLRRVPVNGGLHEEVVGESGLNYHRCGFRSRCVVTFIVQKSVVLYDLDWLSGKRTQLMTMPADAKGDPDVSPDGQQLAVLVGPSDVPAARSIRIIAVDSKASRDIQVKDARRLLSLDWAPDGRGLWSVDGAGLDTRVWYVPLRGEPFVLAGTTGLLPRWVIPSPDGAKLALFSNTIKSNAWMLEGF